MNPVQVHKQHRLLVNEVHIHCVGKRNSFIAQDSGSDNLAKDEGSYWVRNSKIPRQDGSCRIRCASLPLTLVLVQHRIKFQPVQCLIVHSLLITYSFSSAQGQAIKSDITTKCLKVSNHCSVLLCMADRPFVGHKHFEEKEQEEAIDRLCSFR